MNKTLKILINLYDLDEKLKIFKNEEYRGIFGISEKTVKTWENKRRKEFTKLPLNQQSNYERLRNRYGFGVASVSDNSCNNCNSTLPTSFLAQRAPNREVQTCPNCGIFLIL